MGCIVVADGGEMQVFSKIKSFNLVRWGSWRVDGVCLDVGEEKQNGIERGVGFKAHQTAGNAVACPTAGEMEVAVAVAARDKSSGV